MSAGCLRPVRIALPQGTMLSPRWPAPVGDGTGEVAQAVANCLFRALGMAPAGDAASASIALSNVRAHVFEALGPCPNVVWPAMTTASLSDPEVLEARCPLVVEDCHVLPGGGSERVNGGLSRTIRAQERMNCIVSGNAVIRRRDGTVEEQPGRARTVLQAGDAITVLARPGAADGGG
jgi:5-oxoprolinase (ATP-hydrolysing)